LLSPGFIISFFSGIVSISGMIFLYRFRESLSLISISLVSGFLHNLTQLIVVYILMFRNVDITNRAILAFILIFLGIGALSGIITGYIAEKIKIRKVNIYNEKIFWN
ncbi:MAG: Gx transporter family protein, partial [Fusobacteriaceae bacterium]|nr:Gx transporter family protein [Fusobacteriaceae bacterium]